MSYITQILRFIFYLELSNIILKFKIYKLLEIIYFNITMLLFFYYYNKYFI